MDDITNIAVFSKNLKHYMTLANKSRSEICHELGFKYSTFNDWYNGVKYPRIDKIEILAKYFGIEKSKLIEQKEESNVKGVVSGKVFMIPVYESLSAGLGTNPENHIMGYLPATFEDENESKNTIAVQINGDSMSPKMEEGDTIQVRKDMGVKSGEVAVVFVDQKEYVKKYTKKEDFIELASFNPYYPPLIFKGSDMERIRIVGKVTRIIKNL